jgi:NADH dehydrogenase
VEKGESIVVTGALGYSGRYATRLLLERGHTVRTLTNHPDRANPFGDKLAIHPYNFDRPDKLAESLRGASTLINTYWVRFPYGGATYDGAVRNTETLVDAAGRAGIRRIVQVSIANPSLDSPLAYYKGKARLEEIVKASGISHAIARPTAIFGAEDVLINNIAWFVRRFPVFAVPGDGQYRMRPIYVEDMARLLVDSAFETENKTVDAVGPEQYTFNDLIHLIAATIGRKTTVLHMPPALAYLATSVAGGLVGDVVLTWEECLGLLADLLGSDAPAAGPTKLSDWLKTNRSRVGTQYASEVARHFS